MDEKTRRLMFSSASGDWETPQELFDELDKEFDFVLDPCATIHTTKCPYWYGEKDGSLDRPWNNYQSVFVNPPYGRSIGRWVQKGLAESILGAVVVMLLPARPDTAWWRNYVVKALGHGPVYSIEMGKWWKLIAASGEIWFLKGRLKFSGHKNSAPFPSCVVVFRGKSRMSSVKPGG